MKTEIQIAKKNIEIWELTKPTDKELWRLNTAYNRGLEHFESCKRFLKFLESIEITSLRVEDNCKYNNKIENLQDTIFLYKKVGIK